MRPARANPQVFRRFLRDHDLPKPTRFNAPVELNGRRIEVDCLWRQQRLIAELDGRTAHITSDAFHDDRARDQDLVTAGFRVIRITWWQLAHDAERVDRILGKLLAESR